MKILHLVKRYPNSFGGDSIVVWQLAKWQKLSGANVQIVTSNCPDIVNDPDIKKVGLRLSSSQIDAINIKRIMTLMWLVVWSFFYLRRIRPDVIHSHTSDFGFAVSFAAKFYHIPMVNTCHGVTFINPEHSWFKRRLEVFFLKRAQYKFIFTVDKTSLVGFKQEGFNNVQYIANAVDTERFVSAKKYAGGRLELFYVGRIETAKGVQYLLDAVAALPKDLDWHLRLVGDGSKLEHFSDYAEQLHIAEKVEFLGSKKPDETAKLYSLSHVFILPSLHEGFPIVLLEAWAAGVPVIITKVGTVTTVCRDKQNALLIQPKSAKQITQSINLLAQDAALVKRLVTNGQKEVHENFTYAAITEKYLHYYRQAMV